MPAAAGDVGCGMPCRPSGGKHRPSPQAGLASHRPAPLALPSSADKGLMPHPLPLNVVVGPPVVFDIARCEGGEEVDSLDKMVDSYHAQYVKAMRKLYSEHAPKYTPGVPLNIVE